MFFSYLFIFNSRAKVSIFFLYSQAFRLLFQKPQSQRMRAHRFIMKETLFVYTGNIVFALLTKVSNTADKCRQIC